MSGMREASKPHRNRTITVEICSSEPKLITRSCGDQIWRGSVVLSGTVNLDPIPLASCNGWITVNAAELSDDRNEGWRNAPCPMPDSEPVGSDGTGATWPDYDGYDPDDPRASIPDPKTTPGTTTTPGSLPGSGSLPITVSDPTGDLEWFTTGTQRVSGGARLSTDLISLSLSDQDSQGWIRVTFSLGNTFDLLAIAAASTATPRLANAYVSIDFQEPAASIHDSVTHSFGITQYGICHQPCLPGDSGRWVPSYNDGDGFHVRDAAAASYIRSVPGATTGSSFSFEINPPAILRGTPGFFDPAFPSYAPNLALSVDIDDFDLATGTTTYDRQTLDRIDLPVPFTLPDRP